MTALGGLAFVIDDEAWLDDAVEPATADIPFDKLVNAETVTLKRLGTQNKYV